METEFKDFESVIFRMTITRGGRKIRRPDGKPWKIVLRSGVKR
ncbi:hypothetical protein [Hydrogenophaga pseudoflava]|nr:hypothetical protein [Hydrogenophaga pseudoflava]MDQ7745677.1 hypothetical protein [Hydrogenophaga pseudoflava]